jgi:hypothetical protein
MPKKAALTGVNDRDILPFIESSIPEKRRKSSLFKIKPKKKGKKEKESAIGDNAPFLMRQMEKRMKKKVNDKVSEMIKNHHQLDTIDKPKEELYSILAHKLFETQEQHKLYKGETTNSVYKKGKTIKEVNKDSQILTT